MDKDFNQDNPQNWKFGFFYFNPKDSRYIVPKKNQSMGWTFNFAHPVSWMIMALILASVVYGIVTAS